MDAQTFRIESDGDVIERRYWTLFVRDRFPSYEAFWVSNVVPLTYRTADRTNISFRPTEELAAIGRGDEDVTVAQLHYTLLRHLARVRDLLVDLPKGNFGENEFAECLVRLTGAADVADELLERHAHPGQYAAWDERAGERARKAWRKKSGDPLKAIRDYRNRVAHGRVVPSAWFDVDFIDRAGNRLRIRTGPLLPKRHLVDRYLDWRAALAEFAQRRFDDFDEARTIVEQAWLETLRYVESSWRTHLIDATDAGVHGRDSNTG